MSTEQAGGHPDTTAVVGFSAEAVERLLRLAEGETIEILRPPGTGLMMMTVHDAFGTPFHLGEVLVTEAEVGWGGLRGYGQVCGDDPGRALARACAEGRGRMTCSSSASGSCWRPRRSERRRSEAPRKLWSPRPECSST